MTDFEFLYHFLKVLKFSLRDHQDFDVDYIFYFEKLVESIRVNPLVTFLNVSCDQSGWAAKKIRLSI